MSDYNRLKNNLNILSMHNTTNKSVLHLTGFTKTENELIKEIVSDAQKLIDKIENGTLIERPPVKKGDWVYVIHREKHCSLFNDKSYRKKGVWRVVDKIFLNNDNTFTISTLAVSSGGYKHRSIVKSTTFNKSWFLTKAEAEAKLKELQNDT